MAQLDRFNGMLFSASDLIPVGKQVLWNKGAPVVCVSIGAPIEDAECDHIQLNPVDYEKLRDSVRSAR